MPSRDRLLWKLAGSSLPAGPSAEHSDPRDAADVHCPGPDTGLRALFGSWRFGRMCLKSPVQPGGPKEDCLVSTTRYMGAFKVEKE